MTRIVVFTQACHFKMKFKHKMAFKAPGTLNLTLQI